MSSSIPANPTPQTVAALLPKLHDVDPDYRFMSLNDLFQVLTNGRYDFLHNDYNTAARAVDGIIKTLDDQNGEVQNLAIKCLVPLVQKIPISILPPLIEKLSNLTPENSVDNSIPALALRSVVITLPRPVTGVAPTKEVQEAYSAISRVLIPRLIGHLVFPMKPNNPTLPAPPSSMLKAAKDKEVGPEGVDVLIEVVRCFGPLLREEEIVALQDVVQSILESNRASSVVKKRAVVAVSILVSYLTDAGLSTFISKLIESFTNSHITPVQRRLYITILGSLSRSIPSRFGPYLATLAPFVLSALSQQELDDQIENAAEDGEPDAETDDVREAALVALESFLASCGSQMRSFTDDAISASLRFLTYDPNYVDDEDDEEMGEDGDDDMDGLDEDDEFDADGGFDDDDDDASWKVRRCAAKVLYTLISTRGSGDLLDDGTLYAKVAPILVARFSEREENVRLEIIATMASLIRKTGEGVISSAAEENADYINNQPSRKRRRESSSVAFDSRASLSLSAGLRSPVIDPVPASGPRADLARLSSNIVKAVTKQLKGTSIPTKQAVITLLQNMVQVQHGGLSEYFGQIVDPLVDAVGGTGLSNASSTAITSVSATSATGSTLRIAALRLISSLSETHSSSVLLPFFGKVVPAVVAAVNDKFYKISGEAIGTVEQLIKALTPPRSGADNQHHQVDLRTLFQALMGRVAAQGADLDVRQRSIQALGILLARTTGGNGSALLSDAERASALDTLEERLKNETTRFAAVKAINTVAALTDNKDQLDVQWVQRVALELSAQLRKADRALRGASLDALKNLITGSAGVTSLDKSTIKGLVGALLPLLTTSDLHLLGPTLVVLATLVKADANLAMNEELISALSGLLHAPLGGAVLDALLLLVKAIGEAGVGQSLMNSLLQTVSIKGDPAVTGKVIGTLLVYGGSSLGVAIEDFQKELASNNDELRQILALAVLGEAGLRMGPSSPLKPDVFTTHFASKYSKLPLAAAIALGRAGAGNVKAFLPIILTEMTDGKNQYLLLHSVKEILQQSGSSDDIAAMSQDIWEQLIIAAQTEDNKAVGAECIGRLAIISPQTYVPVLQAQLVDESPAIRALVIQAIRYTLPDSDPVFDGILRNILVSMIAIMLADTVLENRRLALTTLNSAANNKPELILPHLNQLLPLVIDESVLKPELIREVMMGPFKHKVDDGMDIRKSAYETLYSLMETSFSRISILPFYDRVIAGLSDEYDIRALCNLMLTKLVVLDVDETTRRLDSIASAFKITLSTKLKESAVKQEIEKQDEAVKSVLRVTLLLTEKIPVAASNIGTASDAHQVWTGYWDWVEKDFTSQLRSLRDEKKNSAIV